MKINMEISKEIGGRLVEFMNYKRLDKGSLSEKLEIEKSTFSNYLSGNRKWPVKIIHDLNILFHDLNIEWLLTGEGHMIKGYRATNENSYVNEGKPPDKYMEKYIKSLEDEVEFLRAQLDKSYAQKRKAQ